MGIKSYFEPYGASAERYVELERMTQLTDEQGGGYVRSGEFFTAIETKLSASQIFFMGREAINTAFRYFADLPLDITEHHRVWHPKFGELDVINVSEEYEEGIVTIDALDVNPSREQ